MLANNQEICVESTILDIANCAQKYYIQEGDSCYSIALGNNMTFPYFKSLNPHLDCSIKGYIFAGQPACIRERTVFVPTVVNGTVAAAGNATVPSTLPLSSTSSASVPSATAAVEQPKPQEPPVVGNGNRGHQPMDRQPAPAAPIDEPDTDDMSVALRMHNSARSEFGVGPLRWSNQLARYVPFPCSIR